MASALTAKRSPCRGQIHCDNFGQWRRSLISDDESVVFSSDPLRTAVMLPVVILADQPRSPDQWRG